jgi:hypothetical protein
MEWSYHPSLHVFWIVMGLTPNIICLQAVLVHGILKFIENYRKMWKRYRKGENSVVADVSFQKQESESEEGREPWGRICDE